MPGQRQCRPWRQGVDKAVPLLRQLPRLAEVRDGRQLACRDVAEVTLDPAAGLRLVEVAGDHQDRVVGRVVGIKEGLHLVEGGRFEVGQVAVEVVGVVPVLVGVLRHDQPGEAAVGAVQHVRLDLVLDHVLLVLEVLLGHRQPAHAVGLGPQHALERVRGYQLEVVGVVEAGRAIDQPAIGLDEAYEFHLAEVCRPLEHHVLEQVRKAGAAARLVAQADVVVHANRDCGCGVVRRQHHAQAVAEPEVRHGYVDGAGRGRRCRLLRGGSRYATSQQAQQGERQGAGKQRVHRGRYLGCMRMAPSRRIVLPFSMGLP